MTFRDLRSYLGYLEEIGDIVHVREPVDSKFEISSYTECAYIKGKLRGEPALYFERVKGHSIPVVTNLFGTYKRFSSIYGLTEDNFFPALAERYEKTVEPKTVSQAPCQDVVLLGDEADLSRFPIMWWNEHDGGPYINSGVDITKDPDTGKHNAARYRLQLKGRRKLGVYISERQHIGIHFNKWKARGAKEMDIAVALGVPPSLEIASVSNIPYGVEEYAWAGGQTESGEPIELVPGKTVDLLVPAQAEIIIEGKVPLDIFESEGPLGEYTGYYTGTYNHPVINVTAITHRKNPIMTGILMANMPGENLLIGVIPDDVILYRELKRQLSEVTGFRYLFATYTAVIQVDRKRKYPGIARRVADCFWGHKYGSVCKNVIVVDNDVDIYNEAHIFWAMSVRTQADRDVSITSNCAGSGIDPSEAIHASSPRSIGKGGVTRRSSHLLWDATESIDLPPEIKVVERPPGFEEVVPKYEKLRSRS